MRRRSTTWMWDQACQTLARTERLRQQFFEVTVEPGEAGPAWQAPVDVFEHRGTLVVWIALPGVAPESVDIGVDGRTLSVAAFRRLRVEPRSAVIRRLEIPHGRLERRIELPAAGYVIETREAQHGCVRICLRKDTRKRKVVK